MRDCEEQRNVAMPIGNISLCLKYTKAKAVQYSKIKWTIPCNYRISSVHIDKM